MSTFTPRCTFLSRKIPLFIVAAGKLCYSSMAELLTLWVTWKKVQCELSHNPFVTSTGLYDAMSLPHEGAPAQDSTLGAEVWRALLVIAAFY